MTTTLEPCFLHSFKLFASSREFKFPATNRGKSVLRLQAQGKITHQFIPAKSATACDTDVPRFDENSLIRRREFVHLSTIPFLLPFCVSEKEFAANALEVDGDEQSVMQIEIKKVVSKAKAPGMLRLVFHDAGTYQTEENSGGMNGSIILELDRPENSGLSKSVKILEKAKGVIDKYEQVSWADMIAMAGAQAVFVCGGPFIPVRLGRKDSMVPDAEGKLPLETLDAPALKKCFLSKGLSTQELVVLSGAHTIGGKGFGNPTVFDNSYFKVLLEKPWRSSGGMSSMVGLPSDHALAEDEECIRWITAYAGDQTKFFEDFKRAYIKLVNSGAKWKNA
ncbi:hypothetical protein H6P81_000273 [Aristolochia fimbriata]|uniref:L-ascorbate peroxidase n=1 Tax=Aristolochia fimbriata TaxID=158543 RepID=A0AAV7F3M7_ARIFI|nr:hypothetical protein H6P81_000273 [Aristolochia fimbriata]